MLVQLSFRAKRLNRECVKELQILISMVRKVYASSKIMMMSDDEVLVVVDKEPVAIQNTTQTALQMVKCNYCCRYNLVFQNHAMKHALHMVN